MKDNKYLFTILDSSRYTDRITEINDRLNRVGVKLSQDGTILEVSINNDTIDNIVKRNAGHKAKTFNITIEDLKKRINKEGIEAVSDDLNVSTRTLYRRLKRYKDSNGDTLI